METHHLSLGAHLLLWVFPLLLVAGVVIEAVLSARKESRS